jgi:hypothetical protein
MTRTDNEQFAGDTEESQSGYPEEAPPGADPGGDRERSEDSPPRESAKAPRRNDDQSDEADNGTATGNPHAAG